MFQGNQADRVKPEELILSDEMKLNNFAMRFLINCWSYGL